MKIIYLTLALFYCSSLVSQNVELFIRDFDTKQAIPNAIISHRNKPIAKANVEGKALISLDYKIVKIQSLGYDTLEVVLGGKNQTVYLYKNTSKIKEVVVKPIVDAYANFWIEKMVANQKTNHPNTLNSYQFDVYSKFTADAEEDTVIKLKDKADTSDYLELKDFVKHSKLFVWERLTNFKHHTDYGNKKTLLLSKMSGFKQPIYELLAMSMDDGFIVPGIFKYGSYKQYYFRVEDSMKIKGRKTYQIEFFPTKKLRNKRSRTGYVQIDSATAGLLRYQGTTKEGFTEIQNQIIAEKIFTQELFVNYTDVMFQMNNFKSTTLYKLRVENLQVPAQLSKADLKGYDNEISPTLNDASSQNLLIKLRKEDSLSSREANTYNSLDSIIKKENVETKLRLFLALSKGYIKVGECNFIISDLFQYNRYEGFRLTLSGETNYQFHKQWGLNGYLGYGFGDKVFKYKLGASYLLNYQNQSKLSIEYQNDVFPFGRFNSDLISKSERFNYYVNVWFFQNYYQSHNVKLGFQSDIHKYIEQKISLQYEVLDSKTPYSFQGQNFENVKMLNAGLDLRYYPKTEYIVTPEGKHLIKAKPTQIKLSYRYKYPLNYGFKPYHTLQGEFKTTQHIPLGSTTFAIPFGIGIGDVPITSLYEGWGSANRNTDLYKTFGLGSYRFFETMEPSSFYSNQYAALFVKHRLPYVKLGQKNGLDFSLIYKALYGQLRNANNHSIAITAPDKLYQEIGLEWDNIYRAIPVGLGFYYRVGAYNSGNFGNNFATRLIIAL